MGIINPRPAMRKREARAVEAKLRLHDAWMKHFLADGFGRDESSRRAFLMAKAGSKPPMATTAERLNAAVYKHRIMWADLTARVVANGLPVEEATDQVCLLIEKKSATLPVAVALIDMIVEGAH